MEGARGSKCYPYRRAHASARVSAAHQEGTQPPCGRRLVAGAHLGCPGVSELRGSRELAVRLVVGLIGRQRFVDRLLVDAAATQLRDDRLAPEALALGQL